MSLPLLPVLLAGGGIAYIAATAEGTIEAAPPGAPRQLAPSGGSTITQASAQTAAQKATYASVIAAAHKTSGSVNLAAAATTAGIAAPTLAGGGSYDRGYAYTSTKYIDKSGAVPATIAQLTTQQQQSGWGYTDSQVSGDPALQQKLDALEAAAKKAFNDANEVAKAKAAEYLNKELKLDPPLTGHEDWEAVSAVVAGAAGAAAGTALCGPVCGKLGAMAGAYLGTEIGEWLGKAWPEIEEWLDDTWSDVEGAAQDAWDEVSGWSPF